MKTFRRELATIKGVNPFTSETKKGLALLHEALIKLLKEGFFPRDTGQKKNLAGLRQDKLALDGILAEKEKGEYGQWTTKLVGVIQEKGHLAKTGKVDDQTATLILEFLKLYESRKKADRVQQGISGRGSASTNSKTEKKETVTLTGEARFTDDSKAEGLKLILYKKVLGQKNSLVAETIITEKGSYKLVFDTSIKAGLLEVWVVDGNGQEHSIAELPFSIEEKKDLSLNLTIPATLSTNLIEYREMLADLKEHLGNINLSQIEEDSQQQDLTYLSLATGWDARLIALASIAERLGQEKGLDLSPEAIYGLLRLGLPYDKSRLAWASDQTIEHVLQLAVEKKVVDLNEAEISNAKANFKLFAEKTMSTTLLPNSMFTYGDFLEKSGLDEENRLRFSKAFLNRLGDTASLWERAKKEGVDENALQKLRLQGKWAYLTGNNLTLMDFLQKENINEPIDLVEKDFYEAPKWLKFFEEKGRGKKDDLLPVNYKEQGIDEGQRLYAEELAAKIRFSYPTEIMARFLEKDDRDRFLLGDFRQSVIAFLKGAAKLDFRLGKTPLKNFIRENAGFWDTIPSNERDAIKKGVSSLQRVNQIASSNEAMATLFDIGLQSAYDVVSISRENFLKNYSKEFPSTKEAELVYQKAQQVHGAIYSIWTFGKELTSSLALPTLPSSAEDKKTVKKLLLHQYPTLENLLGSLDYEVYDYCQSVLSPAAYFVDLLQTLDLDEVAWEIFLRDWEKKNKGKSYLDRYKKPYSALLERRPDLPHLSLTCENSEVALPYIDVVNEILEYYLVHSSLGPGAAYDIGDENEDILTAEPQNILLKAYEMLANVKYPLDASFNLHFETLQCFCNHFDVSLADVLATFATGEVSDSAIALTELGLSSADLSIFAHPDPLAKWYEFYGYSSQAEAIKVAYDKNGQRIDLNNGKALARRLSISYKELAEVLQTGFVNPELTKLITLKKLSLSVNDVLFYEKYRHLLNRSTEDLQGTDLVRRNEIDAFLKRLKQAGDQFKEWNFDARTWLEEAISAKSFSKALVLVEGQGANGFEDVELKFADGSPVDPASLLKINFLVRLKKKLFWTYRELDQALKNFLPAWPVIAPNHVKKRPFYQALSCVAYLKKLEKKLGLKEEDRLKLLSLWGSIETNGKQSLYEQLFLNNVNPKTRKIFDEPRGFYLEKSGVFLKDYYILLGKTLNLTSQEIEEILQANSIDPKDAPLSLDNVSLLYRYSYLAEILNLSVHGLLVLIKCSPFHPFKGSGFSTTKDEDCIVSGTLAFVDMVQTFLSTGLEERELLYFLDGDRDGKAGNTKMNRRELLYSLILGLRTVQQDYALPQKADDLNWEMFRQKLTLLLAPEVVEQLFAMLDGNYLFNAIEENVEPEEALSTKDLQGIDAIEGVHYDPVTKRQYLTWSGVPTSAERDVILARNSSVLLGSLLLQIERKARDFFVDNLLSQKSEVPFSGYFEPEDFDLLFAKPSPSSSSQEKQELIDRKYKRLAEVFLPFLREKVTKKYIQETLKSAFEVDGDALDVLLDDSSLWGKSESFVDIWQGVVKGGLTATYYSDEECQEELSTVEVAGVDTGETDEMGQCCRPKEAKSICYSGCLEVPISGIYRFYAHLSGKRIEVELKFEDQSAPLLNGVAEADEERISAWRELKSGRLYPFLVKFRRIKDADGKLLVRGESFSPTGLDFLNLYPGRAVIQAENYLCHIGRILYLLNIYPLTSRELRYFTEYSADLGGFNLNLFVPEKFIAESASPAICTLLYSLAGYIKLRREFPQRETDLINVLTCKDPMENISLAAELVQKNEATIFEILSHWQIDTITLPATVKKLWKALKLLDKLGIGVEEIRKWQEIILPGTDLDICSQIVDDFKESCLLRFGKETWLKWAKPVNDYLRQRRRDVLSSYLTYKIGLTDRDGLYEYFLLDPSMEPAVLTSRLRLAISSVKLFIQRCLLNLEKAVPPAVINAQRWEWLKHYRTWEANRKIFLFPENWLEPEFRDDKTHLFSALEDGLYQEGGDTETAAESFMQYIHGLGEVARLQIVGLYREEKINPSDDVLHVIGRAYSEPHTYYYRTYSYGMWSPWSPVLTEIEGDHILPVVWRGTPYLFWLGFVEEGGSMEGPPIAENKNNVSPIPLVEMTLNEIASSTEEFASHKFVKAHLYWSKFLGDRWSPRKSGGKEGVITIKWPFGQTFDCNSIFVHTSKVYEEGEERAIKIHLDKPFNQAFYFMGCNATPGISTVDNNIDFPYKVIGIDANRFLAQGNLNVTFTEEIVMRGKSEKRSEVKKDILSGGGKFNLVPCNNSLAGGIDYSERFSAPFFYQDELGKTFFVEPQLDEVTIEEWKEWVPPVEITPPFEDEVIDDIRVIPEPKPPFSPWDVIKGGRGRDIPDLFDIDKGRGRVRDWLLDPQTILIFGDVLIGGRGKIDGIMKMETVDKFARIGKKAPMRYEPVVLVDDNGKTRSILTDPALTKEGIKIVGKDGIVSNPNQEINIRIKEGKLKEMGRVVLKGETQR